MASLRVSDFRAVGDVVENGEVGEEREVLEHEPDAALLRRDETVGACDLGIIDEDAAGGGALDAGREAEQRGLAAAGGTEQAEHLARRDVDRDLVERQRVAIAPRHVLEGEARGEGDGGLAAAGQ